MPLNLSLKKHDDPRHIIVFEQVVNKIQNCKFFIAAGQEDFKIIDKIKNSEISSDCISLDHLTIAKILPIIKNCNLCVSCDTSFMHISAALGIRTIGIFTDSPAYAYSGYTKNIYPIVPEGETVESTTHDTLGKDNISFEKVLASFDTLLFC